MFDEVILGAECATSSQPGRARPVDAAQLALVLRFAPENPAALVNGTRDAYAMTDEKVKLRHTIW